MNNMTASRGCYQLRERKYHSTDRAQMLEERGVKDNKGLPGHDETSSLEPDTRNSVPWSFSDRGEASNVVLN